MLSRFDYVSYDETSVKVQGYAKDLCEALEELIHTHAPLSTRSKALALTALEETYMWIGKSIRDEQLARDPVKEG